MRLPLISTRCREPVTVRAAPWNVSFMDDEGPRVDTGQPRSTIRNPQSTIDNPQSGFFVLQAWLRLPL
jgi:hypothetical protein